MTPAMKAGITDHIGGIEEILTFSQYEKVNSN
jgi:hypothetical protein